MLLLLVSRYKVELADGVELGVLVARTLYSLRLHLVRLAPVLVGAVVRVVLVNFCISCSFPVLRLSKGWG
jgi:hypothetical protein